MSDDHELFIQLRDERTDARLRHQLRDEAIRRHLPLVHWCVQDFGARRDVREDIVQVGTIGLIHAVDRFDPDRGVGFPAFARPTIRGEILRYFRDRDRAIRLPRRYHDITHAVRASQEHLQHDLGREPDLGDLAHFLGISIIEVETAFAAEAECSVRSLDQGDTDALGRPLTYGALDPRLESVADHHALRQSLWQLPAEERAVIDMLFWKGLTQAQAAAHLGKSQMYVSRTLRRASRHLRDLLSS